MSIPYSIKIYPAVLKLNHADTWKKGRTDMASPICIYFMHIVQRMHNIVNVETVIRMLIKRSFLFPVKLQRGILLMKTLSSMKMQDKLHKVPSLSLGRHAHTQILATGEETVLSQYSWYLASDSKQFPP
jgi:hypothetical protein